MKGITDDVKPADAAYTVTPPAAPKPGDDLKPPAA